MLYYFLMQFEVSLRTHYIFFSFQNADAGSFFPAYIPRAIFDVSFFIIVTTVGLGVIFGIIVDTFSELREEKVNIVQLCTASYTVCTSNVGNRLLAMLNSAQSVCNRYLMQAYIILLGLLYSFVRLVLISPNGSYARVTVACASHQSIFYNHHHPYIAIDCNVTCVILADSTRFDRCSMCRCILHLS